MTTNNPLLETARRIGRDIAGPAADTVDAQARFPKEAVDALKGERLLSAFVPVELGGFGCDIKTLSACCEALGEHCATTAMVFAMHQIQVACLTRHGHSPFFKSYLTELCQQQRLIASVTSEAGVGGDLRSSIAAVTRQGSACTLKKEATTVSYGEQADGLAVTARRSPEAAPGDQVLVLLRRDDYVLEKTGSWLTLGMRGTVSPPFRVIAQFPEAQILPVPFSEISIQTMVPFAHILWSSVWLGIAVDALSRARAFIRAAARKTPGIVPPGAVRLAEAASQLQIMRDNIHNAIEKYEMIIASGEINQLSDFGFSLLINNVKVAASLLVVQIVQQAMVICGVAGYKTDSKYSLGRHLRDAYSASLMINNDRILTTNASMLLVHKDEYS